MTDRLTYHVLIVEDSETDLVIAQRAVEKARNGFTLEVRSAKTLEAALENIRWADCVVLDLNLPDSEGTETVKAIRAANPSLPIVVVTANTDADVHHNVGVLGAYTCLLKGISLEGLASAVACLLGHASRVLIAKRACLAKLEAQHG